MPLALITGASTGIGRASALRLVGAGWTVLAGVRDPAAGEALAAAVSGPGQLTPLRLDVTDADQVRAAATLVDEQGPGGLDALVNNAGIGIGGPLELLSTDDVRRQFEVNVFGQIAVTHALLPALRRARGRIVFVSSIGGRVAMAFTAPYAASKHAIEAIGDTLRVELHSSGVQVALIEPGSVATPIWDKGRAEADRITIPPELAEQYGHVPAAMDKVLQDTARRGVPPEQVAATIERALLRPAHALPLCRRTRREGDADRQAPAAGPRLRPPRPSRPRRLGGLSPRSRGSGAVRAGAGTSPATRTGSSWRPASAACRVGRSAPEAFRRSTRAGTGPGRRAPWFRRRARCRLPSDTAWRRGRAVQGQHPLQVDRVVLGREVEQVAEALQRRLLELLRARALDGFAPSAGTAAPAA